MSFKNQTAIVTGGAQGIGYQIGKASSVHLMQLTKPWVKLIFW